MKKSLNAWTVEGSLNFEETFAAVSAAGFDGIELNVDGSGAHSITLSTTKEEFAAIRALSEKYNLPVVSISTSLWGAKMGHPDEWDAGRELIRKQLEAAAELGAGGILIVPGGMGGDYTIASVRKNSIDFLKSMKDEIEEKGIFVGVENVWNGFFLSPYDMMSFLDELDPELFGLYYDLGNMVAFSDTIHWTEIVAPRALKIHIKDYKRNGGINRGGRFCQLLEGDVDFEGAMALLRAAGFDGYLTAEVSRDDESVAWSDYFASISKAEDKIIEFYNK